MQKYKHIHPIKPQYPPYPTAHLKYGAAYQEPIPENTAPSVRKDGITRVQQVVGSILYYYQSVDSTFLMALYTITSDQEK